MPETTYVPDPRPQPPTTAPSRFFGSEVFEGRAPAPPPNRRRPAVSYTSAGVLVVWDVISGQWVSAGGSSSSSLPAEIGSSSEPGLALDYFDDYAVGALSSLTAGLGWGSNNGVVSGASIVSSTMADARIHKRLSLNNGYIGRKMPWGALWNRIVIILAVRINGGVTFANTNGYIGVCTGTTNMVDSATTTNFVGVRWGDGTGTSTFTAGTKISFFDVPTFRACTRRVNTTTDKGGLSSGHTVSANEGYLSTVAIEISRPVFANDASSINYSVAEASTNQTTVQFSHEKDCIRAMLYGDFSTTLLSPNIISSVMGASGVTATPFAFDQSTGVFDTINIYWPQSAQTLEIAALGIRKIF